MIKFNLPTLVTLTAPTCAGKNFLLEAMVDRLGFGRIVSTTDRAARDGEVEGLHYFFISTTQSELKEKMGLFAELVTYNGTRYGVTHEEMARKMHPSAPPPIVILEPSGLEIYKKYCAEKGWQVFSIFVNTPESVRLERLVSRTAADIAAELRGSANDTQRVITKHLRRHTDRLTSVIDNERSWGNQTIWDVIVDGTDATKALVDIAAGVNWRNKRTEIYA